MCVCVCVCVCVYVLASQVAQWVENPPAMQETQETWLGQSLDGKDPLDEGTATHSSILAWSIHGQRSLASYCPYDHKESDTTEATEHALMHTYICPVC